MSEKQKNRYINFMGQRKLATAFSGILLLVSLAGLFINGLNLGLDFTGGTQVRVSFERSVNLDTVRRVVSEQGFLDPVVVYYGSESEVMIRFQGSLEDVATARLAATLNKLAPGAQVEAVSGQAEAYQSQVLISGLDNPKQVAEQLFPPQVYGQVDVRPGKDGSTFLLRRNIADPVADTFADALEEAVGFGARLQDVSFVGSQVGDEMGDNAVIGLLVALAIVMLYVALRFQYKFAVGAVAALAHDVLIVVGFFAITQMEVDLTVFAAVLAVIGYSLNDTIVVFDRIRENFRKIRKSGPVDIVNISLSQTLDRTLVTSLTTLLVLFALLFLGGEVIRGFSVALIVGIVIGTYSSIYVASNILLAMHISKEDLIVPVKEGAEFDQMP